MPDKLRSFWQSATDGLNGGQLWDQFRRETRSSLDLYSAETGRNLREEWSTKKGHRRVISAVARAMYKRLTPVRRVLLLLALWILPVLNFTTRSGQQVTFGSNATPTALILLFLLVLELADRVGLKRDLEIARDIQHMLLPEKPPAIPGLDIAFATKAANTVAGDYYDAFQRPGAADSLLLIVADVAGKGIPAGLLMAAVQTGLHTLAAEPAPLTDLAARLNRAMCERSGGGRHLITAFLAELDTASRSLIWVNAGHNPPILRRSAGTLEYLKDGGLPLGAFPASRYQSGRSELSPGDTLFVYTDGVVEAQNASGAEYGDDRLAREVAALGAADAAAGLKRIFESVDRFAAATPQYDDITCLVLRVKPAGRVFG